ncbi:SDR family NAD(P)-dependent oxidoreductase [Lacisediminihabitans profunda]|uniref:SDR family NAD(P)-dependent oxidoreductase n=1 Tax=Lacisediminihabitans profunda TaxID=2594790 RepID=UPI001C9CF76E|nr:SDR family NAD(P)-dependent oxidoreductase [Lacisediminihabitans profunda]
MTSPTKAWIITGPTSGIGYRTALELAKHGTVVLVGRSASKLDAVRAEIESTGGRAVSVVSDLSDITSARNAGAEIAALGLPIGGLLNNAGIFPARPSTSAQGWDTVFATNHLGPFALTEALIPSLPDGANVVFVVSAVEDPERKIAVQAGFRGGRYISAKASARGEWLSPGSSKLAGPIPTPPPNKRRSQPLSRLLANTRLRFNAIEPGVNPGSNLGRAMAPALVAVSKLVAPLLQVMPHYTTPKKAAKVIARIVTSADSSTGVYFDENGSSMKGSKQVHDPAFQGRVVSETRALLGTANGI